MLFARHLGAASCSRTRPWPEARFAQQLCRYSTQQLLHPTAVIGARAKVGEGVRIGPFCVVSDGAIIGPNCDLESGVHILGNTILGAGCVIRSHAVVGAEVRVARRKIHVVISEVDILLNRFRDRQC